MRFLANVLLSLCVTVATPGMPARSVAASQENFYRATTLLTSASRDYDKGNTTVAGGFSFSLNQPQLHPSEQTESSSAPTASQR